MNESPAPNSPTPNSPTEALRQFHAAIGEVPPTQPTLPSHDLLAFRRRLLAEEWAEVQAEFDALDLPDASAKGEAAARLAPLVHELTDLIYAACGTLVQLGVDADAAFAAVHQANMAKQGGPVRSDGKLLKPLGWRPADMEAVLRRQADLERQRGSD